MVRSSLLEVLIRTWFGAQSYNQVYQAQRTSRKAGKKRGGDKSDPKAAEDWKKRTAMDLWKLTETDEKGSERKRRRSSKQERLSPYEQAPQAMRVNANDKESCMVQEGIVRFRRTQAARDVRRICWMALIEILYIASPSTEERAWRQPKIGKAGAEHFPIYIFVKYFGTCIS